MSETNTDVLSAADQLERDCDNLRKSLAKGSTNLLLVPEVRARLHRVIEAAHTLLLKHPEEAPTP